MCCVVPLVRLGVLALVCVVLLPAIAVAQEGAIAGVVRDGSDAVIPGVLVEVTSPALIEKSRSTTTDGSGQYRIVNLPVGTYTVTFALDGFNTLKREAIELTTGFTANVSPVMSVGSRNETVLVTAESPVVDIQSARQITTFSGAQIRDLPTARNITSILALTPGIVSSSNRNGSLSGICSGGAGIFCSPIITDFNAHASGNDIFDGLRQGRIMIDGVPINSGVQGQLNGMTGGYTADIANAQEVNIQISGALGESETGGASINIIPLSGGNTFKGAYNSTYTRNSWFGTNNRTHTTVNVINTIDYDYDVSGTFGGPIKRDRLWFYAQARDQGKRATPPGGSFFYNANEGKMGANYVPDRNRGNIFYKNTWRNVSARMTYQATHSNKFQFLWDEQDVCQDPCDGVVSTFTSPESWWSVATKPNRLLQTSWTNPATNRLLFEAGLTATIQHLDTTKHRYLTNPQSIPRVVEFGDTAGLDAVATRVNAFAGAAFSGLTSGSLNSSINATGVNSEAREVNNYRSRASASYVTGRHHAKIGYEGGFFKQLVTNQANDQRLEYRYDTPAVTCIATLTCGNTSLYFPEDPNNLLRRPVPTRVTINTGVGTLSEQVMFAGFYAQDTWTWKRFSMSGALRYDHATSRYNETCVGPDVFVPVQTDGRLGYCTPPADGVSYHDITPRWGVTWDLFGTGKTAVKWNMGKYLGGAGLNDIYTNANLARRTVNSYTRLWNDTNGNRIPDCNLLDFANNGECTTPLGGQDGVRYGRDPVSLDAAGTPIGLNTTQCGRGEQGIPAAVRAYCAAYGETLLEGWGKRRSEWQFGLGIQHEILPRLSGELTFNWRKYGNLMVTDTVGLGCDRFNGPDLQTCLTDALAYRSSHYDFFTVAAPVDPRLPDGGGYVIRGISNAKLTTVTAGLPQAQTLMKELDYSWYGIDTNFVWRGPQGLRVNGGTSTGRSVRDQCMTELDGPNVKTRVGNPNDFAGGCRPWRPIQTRLNGTASYTVPKIDVLLSTVFQYQIGVERMANLTFAKEQVTWDAASASRATAPCTVAGVPSTGCFVASGFTTTQTTYQVNLLDTGDLYGEGAALFDLKVAKTLRFNQRRLNVGVDIYNVLNSDAITGYNSTYTLDNPATPAVEVNNWGQATSLVNPRFVRLSVQFEF
jgi:hypothetical protein